MMKIRLRDRPTVKLRVVPAIGLSKATEADAAAGLSDDRAMTPLKVSQAIAASPTIAGKAPASRQIATAGLATGGGSLGADRTITVPKASSADVAAGADDTKAVTSAALKPALDAKANTADLPAAIPQAEAEAGTATTPRIYTAQRVDQQITAKTRLIARPNAISRPFIEVTQDWVNASEFGVRYDGSDETAKLQAALNAVGSGHIVLTGSPKISGRLTMPNDATTLFGPDRRSALIHSTALTQGMLLVTGSRCGLNNVSFAYDGTPTGGDVVRWDGDEGRSQDVVIYSAYNGWRQVGHGMQSSGLNLYNYAAGGLIHDGTANAAGCVGGWFELFKLNAGDQTRGVDGGIRQIGRVESVNLLFGEVLSGVRTLFIDGLTGTVSNRNQTNKYHGVWFDSGRDDCIVQNAYYLSFNGCWFSGGREGVKSGVHLISGRAISFGDCDFVHCGRTGLEVEPGCKLVSVTSSRAFDNSLAAPSSCHGVVFADGCTDFVISNMLTGNGLSGAGAWLGSQLYGAVVGGSCDRFSVRDVRGNTNGAAAAASYTTLGAGKVLADCF